MVYGIDIRKIYNSTIKMDLAMSSPLEPMLELNVVTYWAHAVRKGEYSVFRGFSSLEMVNIAAQTSTWTHTFKFST